MRVNFFGNTIQKKGITYSTRNGNYTGKSLGLGSPISQMCAVFYPNRIDHYCKEKLRCKYYGRYMDDIYIIDNSKERLRFILNEIKHSCLPYGITLNERKTRIVKLSCGFSFLKTKFNLLPTGRILKRIEHASVVRMRRKLKKLKMLKDKGLITIPEINNSYQSWCGYAKHKSTYKTRRSMQTLYNTLFKGE